MLPQAYRTNYMCFVLDIRPHRHHTGMFAHFGREVRIFKEEKTCRNVLPAAPRKGPKCVPCGRIGDLRDGLN